MTWGVAIKPLGGSGNAEGSRGGISAVLTNEPSSENVTSAGLLVAESIKRT